jgi:hypothetical protein
MNDELKDFEGSNDGLIEVMLRNLPGGSEETNENPMKTILISRVY